MSIHKAIVVAVKVNPHPDPEVHSLAVATIFGETVIVGKDTPDGELGIFFGCELQLSREFAEANDLIRRKDENGNTVGGMFDDNRRVRIQKLRGVKSNGFWCPLSYLSSFGSVDNLKEGDELDEFNGVPICNKYVTLRTKKIGGQNKEGSKRSGATTWFPKHRDTSQFRTSLHEIKPGNEVIVTEKAHGTSQRVARNYDERKLKWWERILVRLGVKINDLEMTEYNGTRNVIIGTRTGGFHSENMRSIAAGRVLPFVDHHMEVFFEVVGYDGQTLIMPSHPTAKSKDKVLRKKYGETISYTYGCVPGAFDIYVYRIAYVLPDGKTVDWLWDDIVEWCKYNNINHVPELDRFVFDGNTEAMAQRIGQLSEGEDVIDPSHIREGVVVRVNSNEWKAFKEKSWSFRVLEGLVKEDDNYVDMEEIS